MNVNNQQHIKAVNLDSRSRKRVRFLSSKQREQLATADIYRSYNRPSVGIATSSATRERQVYHGSIKTDADSGPVQKKRKMDSSEILAEEDEPDWSASTFASELDLARERNSSQLFSRLFKELSPLVSSLPEILHHLSDIVSILLSHVVSLSTDPSSPSPSDRTKVQTISQSSQQNRILCVGNLVTADVLHLLSVLARDVQGDIHSHLFQSILLRIVFDLIQPHSTHAQGTLNVTVVESAFRSLSYMFRYDMTITPKDMDTLRQFYGSTLGHSLEYVRRLAAETFAPLIRRIHSDLGRAQHVRKVVHALCRSSSTVTHRLPLDAIHTCKGVQGKLHSKTSGGI